MSYLIDGYNFLFRLTRERGATFAEKREAFIEVLDEALSPFKAYVQVIFDSHDQQTDYAQKAVKSHVEICYAPRGQTADHYIVELCETHPNPKTVTVVTSDAQLAKECLYTGAKTTTIEEFLEKLQTKNRNQEDVKPLYKESQRELERLRKIFEERLKDH